MPTARAFVLVLAIGLPLASGVFAVATASHADDTEPETAEAARAPARWVPGWLMEPLSRAIADATDPRDRKAK